MTWVAQDPAYRRLKNQLIAATGLAFYADRDEVLTELVDARLRDLKLHNCSAYLKLLGRGEEGGAEMDFLTAQLTIGETYFFRDEGQFAALRDIVLPDILERNQLSKRLRIWSAGCSTGAEPYSLAILLSRELAGRIEDWQIHIYASDLNRSYLAQAAEGKFRAWALRSVSDEVKRECFTNQGRIWTIHPQYKKWISFHHMNLVGCEFSMPVTEGGQFDLILCRNVMIYFAPETNHRLVAQFHSSLEEGGWLMVGASEYNLENYTAFRTVNVTDAKLYQKMPLVRTEAAPEPPVTSRAALLAIPEQPSMEGLRQLADHGDWQDAAVYGHRLLAQDRLNPEIHFYQALIFESLGAPDESERWLRQAIYLDRTFALAHYHLGLAQQRDGRTSEAARCFENVLRILAARPDDAMVTAGAGVTVAAVKELARMHLENSRGQEAKA